MRWRLCRGSLSHTCTFACTARGFLGFRHTPDRRQKLLGFVKVLPVKAEVDVGGTTCRLASRAGMHA